jgi:hypothetical protein
VLFISHTKRSKVIFALTSNVVGVEEPDQVMHPSLRLALRPASQVDERRACADCGREHGEHIVLAPASAKILITHATQYISLSLACANKRNSRCACINKSQQSHLDEVLLTLLPQGMKTLLVRSSGSSACISFSGAKLSCRPRTPLVGHFARLAVTQKGLQTWVNTNADFTMSVFWFVMSDPALGTRQKMIYCNSFTASK